MSEKLVSFRVDEYLRDEFKLAAAYRRKTMAEILKSKIVEFVEESMEMMSKAQDLRDNRKETAKNVV